MTATWKLVGKHPITLTAFGFYLMAAFLYVLQNNVIHLGGKVAFVKVLWLVTALFLWFVLPSFITQSRKVPPILKKWFYFFWFSMILRGIIELFLMYVTKTWHPYMGIGHDLFTAALVVVAFRTTGYTSHSPARFIRGTFPFLAATLLVEAGFAYYMLTNVESTDPVYYVPNSDEHSVIFLITWLAIGLCSFYLLFFVRRWVQLHLNAER